MRPTKTKKHSELLPGDVIFAAIDPSEVGQHVKWIKPNYIASDSLLIATIVSTNRLRSRYCIINTAEHGTCETKDFYVFFLV